MITYEHRNITPDDAAEMLERMGRNRNLIPTRVEKIKDDILAGRFTECVNPICFNSEGILIDGQHRLEAIIRANKPVMLNIALNVPDDAVIDKGAERNTSQSLYMRGVLNKDESNPVIIATAKCYLSIKDGYRSAVISDDVIGEFVHQNYFELSTAKALTPSSKGSLVNRAPVRAALFAALLEGVETEILSNFVTCVNSGYINGNEESSAITLRNYLLEVASNGKQIANKISAFTEQAIHDFVSGTPRRKRYSKENHVYILPDREKAA